MQEQATKVQHARRWFITGATGFIGRELINSLTSSRSRKDQISVLVRPGRYASAAERCASVLSQLLGEEELSRIEVLSGDAEQPRFGLSTGDWNAVSQSTHLIHLAANTSFSASLEQARDCNLRGTRHMAELATDCLRHGTLQHWSHVSTAYVVGDRTDLIHPGDLHFGNRFRNHYEQSKNESEHFLQPLLDDFPLTILRPSIVIGHSETGHAGNFNTVYWAVRSYLSGQMKLYARPGTPLDLVPVDYVVNAMLCLADCPTARGKTLHLAGGENTTVSLLEFAQRSCEYFDSPVPDISNPMRLKLLRGVMMLAKLSARHKRFIEQAESYLPYFCQNPRFDTRATESMLADAGIAVPKLDSYLPRVLDYCLAQPWGRRSKLPGTGYQPGNMAHG